MKKKIMLGMMLGMFLIALAVACENPYDYLEKDELYDLKVRCIDVNHSSCDSTTTTCQLSATYPNGDNLLVNQSMTANPTYFNYTFNETHTSQLGDINLLGICQGANELDTEFCLRVTPNGENPTITKGFIQLGLLVVLVIFLIFSITGVFYVEDYKGRFVLYWVCHVLTVAISFIAWQMASDYLTGTPMIAGMFKIVFYFFIISVIPMVILSMAWIFYIHTMNDTIKGFIERGMDENEAFERAGRKL